MIVFWRFAAASACTAFIARSLRLGRGGCACLRISHGRRRGGGCRLHRRIDPAGVYASVQTFRRLGVERALAHDAAERRLDMAGRTAEPVVGVEVAEGGIEVVAPQ